MHTEKKQGRHDKNYDELAIVLNECERIGTNVAPTIFQITDDFVCL